MRKIYQEILFTGFILLSVVPVVMGQRSNGLTTEGIVSVEEGSVDGAVIQIIQDERQTDEYGISPGGQYRLELNYNHEFILIFTRPGNFPQKVVVDTKVPREVLQSDPFFPPFPVHIKLFTEIPGIDRTFSENTVLKIYYSAKVDNFIADIYYNEAQIKNLIDQAIFQSRLIDQESDYLAGLTRAELAELRKEYDQLIKEAENEYKNEEFLKALDGYQAASRIFPKEQYPKDRIAEINDLLGLLMVAEEMQQALAKRLITLINQADQLFSEQKYQEARNAYQRALSIDPANSHALQRVKEIAAILDQLQIEKKYQNLILQADNSFKELLYADARKDYQQALQLKENEAYPRQRIEEIDQILAQQAQNAEKLKTYEESIFQAELNFEKQFYEKAISFYEIALMHKPGDEVASLRIAEIKNLMNELANRTMYDKLIKSADRFFQRKQYTKALAEYEHAAELIPEEEYPKIRISRINEIFEEETRLAAEAAAAEQARLAALEAEKTRQYNRAVSRGDSLFNLEEYESSHSAYQSALEVKPEENYPRQRITEIEQVLAQLAGARKTYEEAIVLGDREFSREAFDQAKAAYTEAQQAIPEEDYPVEMLAKIDSIVETRARLAAEAAADKQARLELEKKYQTIILAADEFFRNESWNEAKAEYEKAMEVKPGEDYPKSQVTKIDYLLRQQQERVLTEQQAAEDMERRKNTIEQRQQEMSERQEISETALTQLYEEYISLADAYFDNKHYNVSRAWYYKAWDVKPGETYPQQRIDEINRLVGSLLLSQRDRDYQQFINLADSSFRDNQLAVARGWYNRALSVKSDESYPREQLQAIADLIAERLESRSGEIFGKHMQNASDAFNNGNYNVARFWFKKALELRPDDEQAKRGLTEIEEALK